MVLSGGGRGREGLEDERVAADRPAGAGEPGCRGRRRRRRRRRWRAQPRRGSEGSHGRRGALPRSRRRRCSSRRRLGPLPPALLRGQDPGRLQLGAQARALRGRVFREKTRRARNGPGRRRVAVSASHSSRDPRRPHPPDRQGARGPQPARRSASAAPPWKAAAPGSQDAADPRRRPGRGGGGAEGRARRSGRGGGQGQGGRRSSRRRCQGCCCY